MYLISILTKYRVLTLLCILLILLTGCVRVYTTRNPTPKDFLARGDADIFYFDDIVYSNVAQEDWVKHLDYSIGEEIGEITNVTSDHRNFIHGTANKLPVGTKIYKTNTQIYVAIVDGNEIPYMAMIEG